MSKHAFPIPNNSEKAIVLLIKKLSGEVRYFADFQKGQMISAWSLAGAKIFLTDNPQLAHIERALYEKKYLFERREVGLIKSKVLS